MRVSLLAVLCAVAALLPGAPIAAQHDPATVEIVALSNRADLISGGDVLLEIHLPDGADPTAVRVDAGGRDVTSAFALREDGRFAGVLEGLELGTTLVTATLPDGSGARLEVTNSPVGGPIFSGPQIQPWYCAPDALDAQCNRPTAFTWQYKNTDGEFGAYDPANPPSDVATTTTDQGKEVPYIVRLETGTLNRGLYRIAVLTTPTEQWDRWTGPGAWNHKLLVPHGSGCNSGHAEGVAPDVMLDHALSRGFAVMSHALEDNSENCNLVVQAESVMMLKEHVVEDYGDVRYQMGVGCSGGSIAQLHMANAYPGLYDGLIVGCTYPDVPVNDLLDCQVLLRYLQEPWTWAPGVVWTEQDMARAAGLQSFSVCVAWAVSYSGIFDPDAAGGCDVPEREPEKLYNAQTNPGGVRCSYQDYAVNVLGTRPPERWGEIEKGISAGFANRPWDNVGMMYGLRAWQQGDITTAQFVDLNRKAGAIGMDYEKIPERIEGDPEGIVNAYRSGQMNEAHNLDRVPIIDIPIPGDRYEFHDNYKSWGLEQRLINANGHGDNHVMWYGPDAQGQVYNPLGIHTDTRPFLAMDRWLTAIEADQRDVPIEQKVVEDRPEDVTDRCETPDQQTCDLLFGSAGNIRWGAGMDTLANDVIKCTLKPLQRNEFMPQHFTDAQWAQLREAFPTGVCDWTKPGVAQQPAVTWQTYAGGPGGEPMGPVPVSVAFGPDGDVCADAPMAKVVDRAQAREVHRTAVDCVIHTAISIGVAPDRYGPERSVTRAQMASFLVNTLRAAGHGSALPAGGGAPEYTDIGGNVHEHNINRLARAGVVTGVGGGAFAPNEPITRAQMASFMVAAAELAGTPLPAPGDHFADVAGVHARSINAGYEAGLFSGTITPEGGSERSGQFSPDRSVVRDQMATFLVALLRHTWS